MLSQAGRRLLLNAAAAECYAVESWKMPSAFMNAPNDFAFRVATKQPPRADGSYEKRKQVGCVCYVELFRGTLPQMRSVTDCESFGSKNGVG